jgi:hypothetical protein
MPLQLSKIPSFLPAHDSSFLSKTSLVPKTLPKPKTLRIELWVLSEKKIQSLATAFVIATITAVHKHAKTAEGEKRTLAQKASLP